MRGILLATLLVTVAPAVFAADASREAVSVPVRFGAHDGFTRVVFDFPTAPKWRVERQGDTVTLIFPPEDHVQTPTGAPPRDVRAITGGAGRVVLILAPGAELRTMRIGNRLALDVLAAKAPAATAAGAPARAGTAPTRAAKLKQRLPKMAPAVVPAAVPIAPEPAPALLTPAAMPAAIIAGNEETPRRLAEGAAPADPTMRGAAESAEGAQAPEAGAGESLPDVTARLPGAIGPLALAALRAEPPAEWGGAAIMLPFAPGTGAAAFRRGREALVVFDDVRPVDLAGLRGDPFFGHAAVQELANGTLLRLPLAPEASLALRRGSRGWLVVETVKPPPLAPIDPTTEAAEKPAAGAMNLLLAAHEAAHVVVLDDPETGSALLVGTQRSAGEGVLVARQTPEFSLLTTWMGVAVEAFSDRPVLRVSKDGFVLGADGERPGLAVSPILPGDAALARAMTLTRHFDFPNLPAAMLEHDLQTATDDAASVPLRERAGPRRAVAAMMIALGLGPEAEAVLQLAADQDPVAANDADTVGLTAIAALVAGRPAEASGIDDPRLSGSDEITLWRAVRQAMRDDHSEAAAAGFAAENRLLLAYPEALRTRLLPLAAETMVNGGREADAAALLAEEKGDASLDFARALLAEKRGDGKAALALYDQLADSPDRLIHARAARHAVDLRLASGALTPAQAAEAEDRLLYAWRGDGRELAARLRLAALRQQAGQWRQELALLRESETLFPADRAAIHARLVAAFADLLHGNGAAALSPIDLVALVQENGDLLPEGAAGEALVAQFADQLTALDLPSQAAPVLERLIQHASSAGAKAAFGAKLASLRLDEHDYAGAQAALDASAGEGLSPSLIAERAILAARVAAGRGNLSLAMSLLAGQTSAEATETRASLLEAAHDWPAAEKALADYVAAAIPGDDLLSEGESRMVLRLAGAAAEANDEAALAELQRKYATRFPDGPLSQMFRVLTQKPVHGMADLAQISKEITAARALPLALQALGPAAPAN